MRGKREGSDEVADGKSMTQEELHVRALGAVQDDLSSPLQNATVIESAEGVTTFPGVLDDPAAQLRMHAALADVANTFPSSSGTQPELELNGSSE
jgi:hypothetical protein